MITIVQEILREDLKKEIHEGFAKHAIEMTGYNELSDVIAFIAKDEDLFIGAVAVQIFWGALHIKYVFVKDEYREKKIASKLMQQAFNFGKNNKCNFAFVETMNFQALGFYQKLGFELDFTRSGYSHGTSFHYLHKDLKK